MESLPTILVPGLLASARLYSEQIPELWRLGPVIIADHTRDDSMEGIAQRILDSAPPRFALIGLSMGGYIAFEIMRLAPERIARLVLLDTSARPDTPEQSEQRRTQIAMAGSGQLAEIADAMFLRVVHRDRRKDERLRGLVRLMATEVGPDAFIRQQTAVIGRADSRPSLGAIRCPTLVLVGEGDELTPPERAAEIANGITGAHLVIVPNAGHLSTLEQPQHVTQALVEFLRT